jgi:DNA-directed RNA polymerase III subunit RPC1
MKETVLQNAPKVMYVLFSASQLTYFDGAFSKKLQFSTLTAQDVVRISEFQVTHRDLYTTTDRAPVKDGVLDRRLVSLCLPPPIQPT